MYNNRSTVIIQGLSVIVYYPGFLFKSQMTVMLLDIAGAKVIELTCMFYRRDIYGL